MTSEIVILITELRNKQRITLPAGSYRFGRSAQCEYVLRRNNVGDHQFTVSFANGQWGVTDGGSDYRTWYNNRYLEPGETSILQSGDVVGLNTDGDADTQEITFRVEEITSVQGDGMAPKKEQTTDAVLRETDIRRKRRVLIGRGDDCDIKLVNDRVSRHHCEILYKDGHYELHDLGSTNGTYVDGVRVTRTVLRNGAVINVPAQVFAFTGGMLHYHAHQSGISIQLVNVYKTVKDANTGKPLNIVDGTSLQVEPNSFVVLVGGSGTGKSSLLTCITGTAPCTAGSVKFDGLDTRSNRNAFEAALGYVPQKDIMHDNLTVEQSLTYTAKLRIAHDATRAEIAAAVAHAIEAVDLQGREKTFISKLSGETSILQSGDVVGLNTDGDADTQEITFRVEEITSVQGDGMAPKKEQTTDAVLRETDIRRKRRVLIGRGDDCDIKLVNDRVSRHHCEILYKDGHYELHDLGSTNGTYVDGVRVTRTVLRNGAVINVPAQVFAFTGGMLHYHAHQSGISIQLVNVYKTVKDANTGKPLNIVDGTSLQVEPNSFVVLVGGSGTGKSSLLTCITGTAPCTAGSVKFDGLDTRSNRNAFEAALGYVPQKDIMHDNLTVEQSLTYTAKLRIAHDATRAEIAAAVAHAIEAVDLQGREKTFISKLSGGQKKRVSIAMELLANPRLLILDEPTSGLSPDLDRSMMELCRRLSHQNCTVLMVTHNMSNINLCDKIAFLGVGGVLCYYGAPEKLNDYFDVEMTSDIFEKLRDPAQIEHYREKYFTTPEFNRLLAVCPEAAQEADKRCSQ